MFPRRFALVRHVDYTGISGVGVVAYGVVFFDGHVVLRWCSDHPATSLWDSIDDLLAVHGHGDATSVQWLDSPADRLQEALQELDFPPGKRRRRERRRDEPTTPGLPVPEPSVNETPPPAPPDQAPPQSTPPAQAPPPDQAQTPNTPPDQAPPQSTPASPAPPPSAPRAHETPATQPSTEASVGEAQGAETGPAPPPPPADGHSRPNAAVEPTEPIEPIVPPQRRSGGRHRRRAEPSEESAGQR